MMAWIFFALTFGQTKNKIKIKSTAWGFDYVAAMQTFTTSSQFPKASAGESKKKKKISPGPTVPMSNLN